METWDFNSSFSFKKNHLFCEDVPVDRIRAELASMVMPCSPFFIYSHSEILRNIASYRTAFANHSPSGVRFELSFSMKSNFNPHLLKTFADQQCFATLVSGFELKLAKQTGFSTENMILNGNGKQMWELKLAVEYGIILNIDSEFGLRQIIQTCRQLNKSARVLIRINPRISVGVHTYVDTSSQRSKFGVTEEPMDEMLDKIKKEPLLKLLGIHCHLGSTIKQTQSFRDSVETMLKAMTLLKNRGFSDAKILNIGGGLGISYNRHEHRTTKAYYDQPETYVLPEPYPTPSELIASISDLLEGQELTVIVEPGRSLVAASSALICSVLGVKSSGDFHFIVIDGAMTEVIRPCLYSAYHHIELTEPTQHSTEERREFDVVGPVCESADFLGKNRFLATPHEGCGLAVFDVGAYCASMASNYNLRARPAEVLVQGNTWKLIRKPDEFEDIMRPFNVD